MHNPKTRARALEVPRTARRTDPDHASSQSPAPRTPKARSAKAVDRRSPRSPIYEKKRPGKVSELETQVAELQEELKKMKNELSQSESLKSRAHQEAEDSKKQLAAMSAKLVESQQELDELWASEESRVQELRKISQDRDRAWESELKAVQTHHAMDSAALASAMNEVQKLKIQLEKAVESQAMQAKHAESAHNEIQTLRVELSETLDLVEELKTQLNERKASEARALEYVSQTREQLETAKLTEETLRAQKHSAMEAATSLERLVGNLRADKNNACSGDVDVKGERENIKAELEKLRGAFKGAERRYQEDRIQTTLQLRNVYELAEQTTSESCQKMAAAEADLERARHDSEGLQAKLLEKEATLQKISEENEHLKRKLEKTTEPEVKADDERRMEAELVANAEMEAELKRVKVQAEQWRKAAEVAAAIVLGDHNENRKFVELTESLGDKLSSPYSEDVEDESPIKKNSNMLKKISVLLKKGQK